MQFDIIAQARTLQGSGASRRLRRAGTVPGIVYGGEAAPVAIETNHNDLLLKMKKEAFYSSIINLVIDGKKEQVLLRDYQTHAYKQLILHIDFQRVDANTKLHMKVPVHYSGEQESPAVKTDKCLVNHIVNELEVTCLPADLPEFIAVDLSGLKKGDSLHVNDLALPKGVKVVTHGKVNPVLVSVAAPAEEEAAPAPAAAPAEEKGKGKGKK